jgi:hypothetical protein
MRNPFIAWRKDGNHPNAADTGSTLARKGD